MAFRTKSPVDIISERVDSGTAFFINSEGVFITAGHVLKNDNYHYFALIEEEIYPIRCVHKEYLCQKKQDLAEYKDLYIGKVDLEKETVPLIFSNDFSRHSSFSPTGFSKLFLLSNNLTDTSITDLDDCDVENYPKSSNNQLKWYNCDTFSFPLLSTTLKVRKDPFAPTYSNGFTIDMKRVPAHGLSGGPVMSNNLVVGILVFENGCIKSEYIISKLAEKGIPFMIQSE